jgi:double-stranded uracil-DNA glycosylase
LKKKPSKADLVSAEGKFVPDIIAPGLQILFCGINPGLYSGAVGHHFARPGNRFWPALHLSGFVPRRLSAEEGELLLNFKLGITNIVERSTTAATDLTKEEIIEGGRRLVDKVIQYHPGYLAVLGIGAYRLAFGKPKAVLGLQDETIGDTGIWILPNPSGLNAHYQLEDLTQLFQELKEEAGL